MMIRVKFGKEGALRFIGHLDVLRTFQKIFRRAGIPMAYSQGFSPHPIMSFALPLGLGLSSEGEYLDAEVFPGDGEGFCPPEEILHCLQAATSQDLPVYGVRVLPDKSGNAMASVGRAVYRLAIMPAWAADLEKTAAELMGQESIIIQKETKSKTVEMDLRPCLCRLEIREQGLYLELAAGSKANIKPELVWGLLTQAHPEWKPLDIRRLDLMTEAGISLGETEGLE